MLKIARAENYAHPLPEGHRFPMIKYELLPEQLLYEGTVTPANFFSPAPISEADLLLTHDLHYWNKLKTLALSRAEERRTGFPLSHALVAREQTIVGGTLQAALFARQWGIAMNVAGGTHHAFTDRGEGFCLLNDQAIAANCLLSRALATKILIIDLDVHQGNGTAQIFRDEPRVFTFSMHGEKNYPLKKEHSDLDIALPDGTGDAAYLKVLHAQLPELFEQVAPDFVFYQCGVDVLETDKLGRINLTLDGCRQRDAAVLHSCHQLGLPLVCSMGGGYSSRLAHIVEAHANTFRLAQEIFF